MIKPHHIDEAYQWLCTRRRYYPDNADIWHLRFHWQAERTRILKSLSDGRYDLTPLQVITMADGTIIHLWCSPDALVLKALTLAITPILPISCRCTHVKGHGGLKYAVRDVQNHLAANDFVMRTDVKAFYESIDHHLLLEKLALYITDRFTLNLLWQSIHRCVERGGLFRDITKGIPRGCPLSPLLGAFFLTELDNTLEQQDVFYVRYMDDVLIMSKRRWGLRKAIKRLNEIFSALGLEQHPDKTFIGRIEKGFDFLGYHFSRKGLRLARKTLTNALEKWHRLYEQWKTAPESAVDPGAYWRRWCRWARGGLSQESRSSINALIDEITVSYPSIQSTPT
jgi:RNA-directed DNA polymerase